MMMRQFIRKLFGLPCDHHRAMSFVEYGEDFWVAECPHCGHRAKLPAPPQEAA